VGVTVLYQRINHEANVTRSEQATRNVPAESSRDFDSASGSINTSDAYQERLKNVARNNRNTQVRIEATRNLRDNNTLIYLARHDRNLQVRIEATRNLKDATTLDYLARHDHNRQLRQMAEETLHRGR